MWTALIPFIFCTSALHLNVHAILFYFEVTNHFKGFLLTKVFVLNHIMKGIVETL